MTTTAAEVLQTETVTHEDGIALAPAPTPIKLSPASSPNVLDANFYNKFLSNAAKARLPSPIRGLLPLEATPGLISLLAGKPNPSTFPIESISFVARSPDSNHPEGFKRTTLTLDGPLLEEALQYGPTAGFEPLRKWFVQLQEYQHKRKPGPDWSLSVGVGSQDLLHKAMEALINPGDGVLVEAPVYAGVIPLLIANKAEIVEVGVDAEGIKSFELRDILEKWPTGKPKPKVLYTVPYGCNPTGMTASIERRKEVLELAHEHDFLILEDDPYYYLYYSEKPRPPSYFALEAQIGKPTGRVLRFDSLSKILAAGFRLGFVTGPKPLVSAINLHTTSANLQCSSTAQLIAYKLLLEWGHNAFYEHTRLVSKFYERKRDVFEAAMQKHLTGLAEWTPPEAGMFYWFKLKIPPTEGAPEGDSEQLIRTKAFEGGVLALPGTVFFPAGRKTSYVRTAFSLSTPEEVDEGLRRLAIVVKKVQAEA